MPAEIEEKISNTVKELTNYRFKDEYRFDSSNSLMKDANSLDRPVMVIAPEGCPEDNGAELRVWVYGGCIATISTRMGEVKVEPQRNISDSQRERNAKLCEYVKNYSHGRATTPYDYGKYLYDGFTDGKDRVYRLSPGMKARYASEDGLGAYKAYEACVCGHKTDRIRDELWAC